MNRRMHGVALFLWLQIFLDSGVVFEKEAGKRSLAQAFVFPEHLVKSPPVGPPHWIPHPSHELVSAIFRAL